MINNKLLKKIQPFVIFHVDKLEENLKEKIFSLCFPEYKGLFLFLNLLSISKTVIIGENNLKEITNFVKELFSSKNKKEREINFYFLNLKNPEKIVEVFNLISKRIFLLNNNEFQKDKKQNNKKK